MTKHRLVIFAAGWSGLSFGWCGMADSFKAKGFDVLQVRYPNHGIDQIQKSVWSLGKLLKTVRPKYDECIFIGHSMGGIVGRYLIQQSPFSKYIDGYVSLATPHYGILWGQLMGLFSASATQMGRGSEFLTELNAATWPERIPALAISAGWEEIVWPHSSTQFRYAENITIPYTTHVSLLFNSRTFYECWAWLVEQFYPDDFTIPIKPGIIISSVAL